MAGSPASGPNLWTLRYGRGMIRLRIPADRVAGFHAPSLPVGEGEAAGPDRLVEALRRSEPSLDSFVAGRRVALFLSDGTREEPRETILAALSRFLSGAASVLPVIATGSHEPDAPATLAVARQVDAALRGAGVRTMPVLVHDPFRGPFLDLGRTPRGTPIRLNARALEAERIVVASDMKPHYFAGYSCPPKYLFPGVAALESIEANHSWTLDGASAAGHHPWHPDPTRCWNPLAVDYCEAFEEATRRIPCYALTFGSSAGAILWAEAGDLRGAAARGMERVDARCVIRCAPARFTVVSPGGWPNDCDLYTGQRALELTAASMADGGETLFLCEASEGAGPAHSIPVFWDPLRGDRRSLAAGGSGPYRLYSHKAVRFARMIVRLQALHLHSTLPDEEVESRGLSPAHDLQAVVDRWLREDPSARVRLFDGASKLNVLAA